MHLVKLGQHKTGNMMLSTYTAIKEGKQAGVSSDIERVLGRPATSLEQLVKTIK